MKGHIGTTIGTVFLAAMAGQRADAAGFAIKEQSATALGNAFAGATSMAEDPSYMFFNPAAVGRLDGHQAAIAGTRISPTAQVTDAEASNPGNAVAAPIGGTDSFEDVGPDAPVPALYGTFELAPAWRLGLGVNAPFALETRYDDDWVGRYHGVKSRVLAINVNPVVAYNPIPRVSLAAGLQLQYIEADLSNAVDFATVTGAAPAGTLDGFADIEGDDTGLGFTLGLLAEPVDGTRLGIAYRSSIDHTLDGDADFTVPAAVAGAAPAVAAAFADTGATAGIELPAMVNLGIAQDLGEQVTVMAEAQWTQWSKFDRLVIDFDSALPDNVTEEEWDDQWFLALGATWRPAPELALRVGVAYDQKPLQAKFRTPRIPDNDRYWVSAGLSWTPHPAVAVTAGYTRIFIEDAEVRLRVDGIGNATRGNLDARYDADIDLMAVGAVIRF